MKEWNNITGGNMQKEPEYVTTDAEGTKQARITLLCEAVTPKGIMGEKNVSPTTAIIPVTFWFAVTIVYLLFSIPGNQALNLGKGNGIQLICPSNILCLLTLSFSIDLSNTSISIQASSPILFNGINSTCIFNQGR